ncbi:hypothetical protein, partial [Serratia bockelmannii]|uniref:hypothetical protein n=1 Tax=Serratia bockelmannii TaxID=2703793 RepID=UPI003FA69F18
VVHLRQQRAFNVRLELQVFRDRPRAPEVWLRAVFYGKCKETENPRGGPNSPRRAESDREPHSSLFIPA